MKYYIAASFERKLDAVQLANRLETVVSTWHSEDESYQPDSKYRAYRDASQIEISDCLIMLIGDSGGCNRFWEFGYAAGLGKRIILIGEFDRCIFERIDFEKYNSIREFLDERKQIPS